MAAEVQTAAAAHHVISYVGLRDPSEVFRLLRDASALICPSLCYEGNPRTLAEAFAVGTPVIATDLGAMHHTVTHGRNGLHCKPGDATDLAEQVQLLFDRPSELVRMRGAARLTFEANFTGERNHAMLAEIYRRAILARTTAGNN